MLFKNLFSIFAKDIGVDLGTANSLVYEKNRGIICREPSIIAVNLKTGQILSFGDEAKRMVGRTPAHIVAVRPLINGVISDFEATQEMLRHLLRKAGGGAGLISGFARVVIGTPFGLTEVERKAVEDAALSAGAVKVYLIDAPLVAALGAGLPIAEPTANLIVDIGGGTTEIAVISMGGIVRAKSLKIAGDKLNEDIIRFIKEEFKLVIGEPTAEELKIAIGSALASGSKLELAIRGRSFSSGLPQEIVVEDSQVRMAIKRSLMSIIEAIREVIEITPPELVGDILKQGVHLCGGGSLLRNIDKLIERETNVSTSVIDDPMTAVARGAGIIVEDLKKYASLLNSVSQPREIKLT